MFGVSTTVLAQLAVSGLVTGFIYALVALGFNAIYNSSGIINFAQGEFVVLGGLFLVGGVNWLHLPLLLAAIFSIACVAVIGALVHLLVIRPAKGLDALRASLATVAVSLLIVAIATRVWGPEPVAVPPFTTGLPYFIGNVVITRQQIVIVVVTSIVVLLLHVFFRRSVTGLAMRAVSLNRTAAEASGIRLERMVMISFMLAAALGAIAGILVTPITGASVDGGFGFALKGFAAAIVGGTGNAAGAVIGGLTLGLVEALSAGYLDSGYQDAVPMLALIAVFLLRPKGILGVHVSRV